MPAVNQTTKHKRTYAKGAYDVAFAMSAFALPTVACNPQVFRDRSVQTAISIASFEFSGAGSNDSKATLSPAEISVPKTANPTWTKELDRRFDELAEKAALEEINEHEKVEFKNLTALRRITQNPPSPEEYFAEMVRRRQIKKVLKNLNSCFSMRHGPVWQNY